jgi:hypothetical protein
MEQETLKKITSKKEFSQLPKKDVERVFFKFEKRQTSEEEKIKLTRDLLRKVYFSFGSLKLLNKKIVDKKKVEDILKKHISTRERFEFYKELYERLLKDFKKVSVIDLGAGINGLSYKYFPENLDYYLGVEAVGQLVELMNYSFKNRGIENAGAIYESLFELEKLKKIISQIKGEKIIFLFKTLDSLEMIERDYSKKLLEEIVPLVNKVVVSFPTRSLIKKEKFKVKRYWFENFIKDKAWECEDFYFGGEKYFVLKKK